MTSRQRQALEKQIQSAMSELAGNPNFEKFIALVRENREAVIDDLCTESTIANQRATLAGIGELRCYKYIIGAYDHYVESRQEQAEQAAGE